MPNCNYCNESFTDKDDEEYLTHLCVEHKEDLGRIDQRRIEQHPDVDLEQLPSRSELALQTLIITVGLVLTITLMYVIIRNDLYGALL